MAAAWADPQTESSMDAEEAAGWESTLAQGTLVKGQSTNPDRGQGCFSSSDGIKHRKRPQLVLEVRQESGGWWETEGQEQRGLLIKGSQRVQKAMG